MHKETFSEREFFSSFQQGEEKGFAHYFHQYYNTMLFFADGIIKDKDAAKDIVEESFLRLWEKRQTLQSQGFIKSYLYSTVKNFCLQKIRNEKRHKLHHERIHYLSDKLASSAHEHLVRTELFYLLSDAINELPPAIGKVIRLTYIDGKDYNEISQELGRSKETIRKQKTRGIELLKKKFPLSMVVVILIQSLQH